MLGSNLKASEYLSRYFQPILYAGTTNLSSHDRRRKIALAINFMSAFVVAINVFVAPVYAILSSNLSILQGAFIEVAFCIIAINLNGLGKYTLSSFLFYFTINSATLYFTAFLGRAVGGELMILFMMGLAIFLFEGVVKIFAILLNYASYVALEYNFKHGVVRSLEFSGQITDFMRWTAYGVISTLVIAIFEIYKKQTDRYYLHEKKDGLKTRIELDKKTRQLQVEVGENQRRAAFYRNAVHEFHGSFGMFKRVIKSLSNTAHLNGDLLQASEITKFASRLDQLAEYNEFQIRNILDLTVYQNSQDIEVKSESVDLAYEVNDLIENYLSFVDDNANRFEIINETNIPSCIYCDRLKILTILRNLLHNAIKFSPSDQVISIILSADSDKRYLSVAVQDRGEGIRKDRMEAIFKLFERQDSSIKGEGFGIGLYLVDKYSAIIGGSIKVDSEVGKGSTFTLDFPYSVPPW